MGSSFLPLYNARLINNRWSKMKRIVLVCIFICFVSARKIKRDTGETEEDLESKSAPCCSTIQVSMDNIGPNIPSNLIPSEQIDYYTDIYKEQENGVWISSSGFAGIWYMSQHDKW